MRGLLHDDLLSIVLGMLFLIAWAATEHERAGSPDELVRVVVR